MSSPNLPHCDCAWPDPRTEPRSPRQPLMDLGHGHLACFYTHTGSEEPVGLMVWHPSSAGWCMSSIAWRHYPSEEQREIAAGRHWSLESLDPLTVSPSLLCHCSDHGFIRGGQWIPA